MCALYVLYLFTRGPSSSSPCCTWLMLKDLVLCKLLILIPHKDPFHCVVEMQSRRRAYAKEMTTSRSSSTDLRLVSVKCMKIARIQTYSESYVLIVVRHSPEPWYLTKYRCILLFSKHTDVHLHNALIEHGSPAPKQRERFTPVRNARANVL